MEEFRIICVNNTIFTIFIAINFDKININNVNIRLLIK